MLETSSPRQATRVDPTTGIVEIAEFIRVGSARMFGFTHLPDGPARAAVVICSPLYAEFIRNYRQEVVIGRRLAERGIAVQRFHYRGQGNSTGHSSETTFESMVQDASAAIEQVRMRAGTDRLGFFGSRFGSLIAAAVASNDESPLCLWDPVLDPATYLHEILRVRRIQALKVGVSASAGEEAMLRELEQSGSVPVLGYTITRSLYESSRGRTLDQELGESRRHVFLIRMGKRGATEKSLDHLVDRWLENGLDVDDRFTGREAWWFTSGEAAIEEVNADATDSTVEWFTGVLQEDDVT